MSSNLVIPENELPIWMKQAQRGVDWGAILVLAFCLIAAWPFISHEGLSSFNNSEHFVYRAADYAAALKEGRLYPRWSPHALKGYGAEIPNYYPPGAAYSAGVIEVLFTNDSIAAVRLVYVISFLFAGSMVYAFVKQRSNALSGVFASLLYIFSPYIVLTVPHVQGDLDLAVSIALLPMFLWVINRLLMRNHTLDYVLIAFICAAIILTKPVILAQAILLSIALFIVDSHGQIEWGKLGLAISAIIAGIGSSAFYWMPALLERGFVKWSDALIAAPDKHLSLSGLFERIQLYNTQIVINAPQFNIGWMLIGFTILAIIIMAYWRKNIRFSLVFLLTGIFLSILGLIIFPRNTELLIGIILCLAIASSYPISILSKNRLGLALSALALLLISIGSMPIWNIAKPQLVMTSDSIVSQEEYEDRAWGIAVLKPGQAIPSFISPTNQNLPPLPTNVNIEGRILDDANFQNTVFEESEFGGSYRIITEKDIRIDSIHYLRAYSAGWHAYLNEQALDLSADSDGLIKATLPDGLLISAGDNVTLSFTYGSTPIRIVAWIITAISIFMIILVAWQRWHTIEFNFDSSDLLTHRQIALVLIFLIIGALIRYSPVYDFVSSYISYPISDLTEGTTAIQNKIDELELWRFKFETQPHQAGKDLELTLFWKLYNPIKSQHQVRLRMISRQTQTITIIAPFHYPSQFPSNRWLANLNMVESYHIQLPNDLESGSYTIMVDVASCPDICLQGTKISPQIITTIQLPQSLVTE